jgi:hypothetical protein
MGFKEGVKYLPGDYVDEGKLLLFIKNEVASRAPRKGCCLNTERERKKKAELLLQQPLPLKRQRGYASAIPILEGEDDKSCSNLLLMYNIVRGYCSAVNEI